MAANKKPRKAYKRKAVVPGAMPIVYGNSKDMLDRMALERYLCLVTIQHGYGEPEHAWSIASALRVACELKDNVEQEERLALVCAMEAIRRVIVRGKEVGRHVCTGTELHALQRGVATADVLVQQSNRRQMRDAACAVLDDEFEEAV